MKTDNAVVISRLGAAETSEIGNLAREFVSEPDTVAAQPIHVSASDALRLWAIRMQNTKFTKRPIHGAESLITRLRTMPPDTDLEQIGFRSTKKAGNLFFDYESGRLIGFVGVELPQSESRPRT